MLTYNDFLFLSELIFFKFLTLISNTENICLHWFPTAAAKLLQMWWLKITQIILQFWRSEA